MENKKRVKRVQELRRSNAATPVPSKKKYKRKPKNEKEKYLKTYCELIAPYFRQFKFQQARTRCGGQNPLTSQVRNALNFVVFITELEPNLDQVMSVGACIIRAQSNERKNNDY